MKISCEYFPPKTPEGMDQLSLVSQTLSKYQPHFFSVTFGAGGSTRQGTLETLRLLQRQTPVSVAPHLSCIGAEKEDLVAIINTYKSLNVKRIVALRGDLPSGMGAVTKIKYASDLVKLIRDETGDFFHIEVAAYPEIHPQAKSVEDDLRNLKRKYEAGANGAITQYFFNPDSYFYFLDECTRRQINLPITPGIMPITQFARLARFSEMCGAEIPRWISQRLESYGDDLKSICAFGTEVVFNLCQRLIAGGAPGLHFYTLNKADATGQLLTLLGFNTEQQKIVSLRK